MTERNKDDLKQQVILGTREYGIGSVLFRHVIGEMLGVNATDMECLGVIFFKGLATPSELAQHTGLVKETAEKVAPLFASLREAQDKIVSSYSEQELELLSDFFKRSVTMWEEEREKLLKQKKGNM